MIQQNNQNSSSQLLATQKISSNTPLFRHLPLTLTTNSFNSLLPLQSDSQLFFIKIFFHLDYVRLTSTDLIDLSFLHLKTILFNQVDSREINKPWHPDPKMPKHKQYQNRIVSKSGIVLGYTKRAKYKGKNTRYVYDIMIDFTGAYFANLTLLEQLNLICYLNSHWKLKCHRIDVAIDDYTRKLFPVGQMIGAFLQGNNFGFKVIDDNYLDIVNNKLVGTLGIGSRRSSLFIRIYTKHKYFVRYEAEFKQKKAQKLFTELCNLSQEEVDENTTIKKLQIALALAALDCIDFRDKSSKNSSNNLSKTRTKRLVFWQEFREKVFSIINKISVSKSL